MTETFGDIRAEKERVEQEYDALVAQLARTQAQLSNKAAKARTLNPDEYRKWLTSKKNEVAEIQRQIQQKKSERAEARRKFNGWQPQYKEEWIDWPDCEGWWWFYGTSRPGDSKGFDMYFFCEDGDGELRFTTGDNDFDDRLEERHWGGKWKFQPEPEEPE